MTVVSSQLTAPCGRRLSPVQWNQDGRHRFDVHACEDVPKFDDGMIRRALLRGSFFCQTVAGLSHAINRQLFEIGYVATVQTDPVDDSIVVEVSKPH
jgi:hypothetical protein